MAALPYMPLFVADYLADTAHLSTIQHGAYLLLIMNYWQRGGPLPNDDARLSRIVRMSVRNWQQIKAPIVELFATGSDSGPQLLQHHRIDRELDRIADKSLKSKKAAQASVERRFSERLADGQTGVEPTYTDKEREEEKVMPAKAGDYAFFGKTIKLAPRHFNEWKRLFKTIPDLEAELSTIDDWWQEQPEEKRSNWFLATKGMLNKRHQANLRERDDGYDPDVITV